jgi:hypothetical protein
VCDEENYNYVEDDGGDGRGVYINMDLRETGFRSGSLTEMVPDVLLTCN